MKILSNICFVCLKAILIYVLTCCIFSSTSIAYENTLTSVEKMNIKLLFDTTAINHHFKTGWGFSCLVNNHVLFDAGADGNALLHNLNLMDINLSDINEIVISHEHHDHSGGLWKILEHSRNIFVYICPSFDQAFKDKIKKLKSIPVISQPFQEITKEIFTTGELSGVYESYKIPEQALVIKSPKGLVIITGCAHPGIINIIKIVKNHFPKNNIYLVLGGFHLTGANKAKIEEIVKNFKTLKVQKVAPLHCSGNLAKKIFKQYYRNDFIQLHVGETLKF